MYSVVTAARAVMEQPEFVVSFVGVVCLLGFLVYRWRRLGRITRTLRALPASKRRYTLEREFRVYPGPDNLPIAFVKRLRQRYRTALLATAAVTAADVSGLVAQQVVAAGKIRWSVDDSTLTADRDGYRWRIEIRNFGSEPVLIDQLVLRVLRRTSHPGKLEQRPNYGPVVPYGTAVTLEPDLTDLPVLDNTNQITLSGKATRILRLNLIARHAPSQGWIYDVQLQGRWRAGPLIGERKWTGTLYRIGWPGMPRWYQQSEAATPAAPPVTDPPHVVD